MSLRPGQKVTVTATVEPRFGIIGPDRTWITIADSWCATDGEFVNVPISALTPVAESEPKWGAGDVVSIDGQTYMLTDNPLGNGPIWCCARRNAANIYPQRMSLLWREGSVTVLFKACPSEAVQHGE